MANEKPNPRLPEPLWHALAKLSHIVSRENTEPPLLHHRCYRSPHSTIDPALRSPNRGNPSQTHALSSSPVANQPSSSSTAPGTCPPAGPASRPCSAPTAIPYSPRTSPPRARIPRCTTGTRTRRDTGQRDAAGARRGAGRRGGDARARRARGERGALGAGEAECQRERVEGGCREAGVRVRVYVWGGVDTGPAGDGGWVGEFSSLAAPSLGSLYGGGEADPDVTVDLARGIYYVHPSHVKAMMYQDVPDAEVAAIAAQLVPQSLAGNWCTSLFAAWRWIPSTYVITLGDQEATVAAEEWIVKSAAESGRCAVDRVVRREVGHCPHWSQAEWMAGLLVEEAERSAR
ncbi:hypothetical protein PMIN03_005375 [Paraphaeosphaeria minitans]